ncbi:MAG: hypothetical protein WA177_04790 [Xanthobacteraceae bacterium]
MSNDSLALSGIAAGLPQEAEYDSVYAAVAATERGRWFLTEYASRNRHIDTDLLMAAITRIEAALRSDGTPNHPARALDINAVTERIADIAFELRERAADPALCDALDTVVHEIGGVPTNGAVDHGAEQVTSSANGHAAIAATGTVSVAEHQGGDSVTAADDSRSGSFEFELQDTEKFAEAAAALAASLNALSDEPEITAAAQSTAAVTAIPEHHYEETVAPELVDTADKTPRWYIEAPDFVFQPAGRQTYGGAAESTGRSDHGHSLLPGAQLLPGPQDDPAELFDLAPPGSILPHSASVLPAPRPAPSPLATSPAPALAQAGQATAIPPPQLRTATAQTVRPVSRPVSPLAALRALSAEELIALFG